MPDKAENMNIVDLYSPTTEAAKASREWPGHVVVHVTIAYNGKSGCYTQISPKGTEDINAVLKGAWSILWAKPDA